MTNRQLNTSGMWTAVDTVLDRHNAVWQERLPFKNAAVRLREAIAALTDPAMKQGRRTTGIAADKAAVELAAARKTDYIGDIVQAYALDTDSKELYHEMEFNAFTIIGMRDGAAWVKMKAVGAKAASMLSILEGYGLHQADLDALNASLADYERLKSAPRDATVQSSSATKTIAEIIREGAGALHRLDKLINTFAEASPDFVREYKQARVIVDAGHGHAERAAAAAEA